MSNTISRRDFIRATAAVSAYGALRSLWPSWMPRFAFANEGTQGGDVLVCIFLRGGADALNMVVPFGDDNYYRARPLLGIKPPDARGERALELDDFFGLNNDMRAMQEIFKTGHMTAVHACGSPSASRSHFEAMDIIERGIDGETGPTSGWLGRHLMATAQEGDSPLRAIGWSDKLQKSLHGYVSANALRSIADFHLTGDIDLANDMSLALTSMYETSAAPLGTAANATLEALETVRRINIDEYKPSNRATYDDSELGRGLKQTAALIKAEAGLEAACIDHGNFDTHVAQSQLLPPLLSTFAENLRAFHDDMLDYLDRVTVVVMSEFGRRVQENGGGGTDHGHGGVVYVMSKHVVQRPVVAHWPGLNTDFLQNGDLQITADYRDVLSEILSKRTARTDLGLVFPGHVYQPIGVFG